MPRLLERSRRLVSYRRKENQKAQYQATLPTMVDAETMVEFVEMVPHTPAMIAALRIYAAHKTKNEEVVVRLAKGYGQDVVGILQSIYKFQRSVQDLLFSESHPRKTMNSIDTAGNHGRRAILCVVLAEVCDRLRTNGRNNHELVSKAKILANRTATVEPKLSSMLISLIRHL